MSIDNLNKTKYAEGFDTTVEAESLPPGLDEDTVRKISAIKEEPEWLLDFRLKAFKKWVSMAEPDWSELQYVPIDYQALSYYSAPKYRNKEDIPQEILDTFEKLGVPLHERDALLGIEEERPLVAVDAVFDSVSIATTFQAELKKQGIIFCSISEAVQDHPDMVKKYLGSVIPYTDNYFATLNSAVFTDGTFVYIPKGVRCPMELNTYFRINARNTGQFERTLIIADADSYVSYLEGCTAPAYDENTLHAACVELVTMDNAEIKYSTVQNWYPGDENGVGGVYNFVTKRAMCKGKNSKVSWTQVETGSAVTWKYPSCILKGDGSIGEFFSVAVTQGKQQADTGTKMIHLGKDTKSTVISKGISFGDSTNTYRGAVKVNPGAHNAKNFTKCDSLMLQDSRALTIPYITCQNNSAKIEHEASAGKISEEQLYYLQSRGLSEDDAMNLVVNGFCKDVFQKLPLEFAAEANKLLSVTLEGAVG
ncbi:Fe-S cluster assembly protein SufB [bacterium]|nr:Fe-S cluster assembly protein SufB [Hellea sp.]MDA7807270.1 Fe-S cluster assembly protein SufB [bacterium]MDA9047774.1 Fe-S cluster assembly protein SufB [Hellea sp.]MDA9225322.1 Fe-S cluster assembly protein SufB [bacterium]